MPLLEDAFAALSDLRAALRAEDRLGCHVFISTPPTRDRREKWFKIAMEGDVADQVADAARNSLNKFDARATDDQALAEFDFDAAVAGSIGVLPIKDIPEIANWLDTVPTDDWPIRFDGDERILERIMSRAVV